MVKEVTEIDKILNCICDNKNFLLSGGAGSGKTYSLIQTINKVKESYDSCNIACITYTNVASDEIKSRVIDNNNLSVSTIHDFLWDNIKNYQKELKICLIELIREEQIKSKIENLDDNYFMDMEIQYKEYLNIQNGIISHDEVLKLANKMYEKYKILCDILKDKYNFIFVDEYQDTNELVIEILLKFLNKSKKTNIIGFFGDSMQAIYNDGIGDLNEYLLNGNIMEIQKTQNRRNPQMVIDLANKIRSDGLIQEPSHDIIAPNMIEGNIKMGEIKFLYSEEDIDYEELKGKDIFKNWNFDDTKNTKELDLTHNLIASRAGFKDLMNIYDKDPILPIKIQLLKEIKDDIVDDNKTFGEIISLYPNIQAIVNRIIQNEESRQLFDSIKNKLFYKVKKMYFSKDSLVDDKKLSPEDESKKGRKRDDLINQLFKINNIVLAYENSNYNSFIKQIDCKVTSVKDKKHIKEKIEKLKASQKQTIDDVINCAHEINFCTKDDKFNLFIDNNEYLYERVKKLPYEQFQKLFSYLEGYTPFSTQHKVKGAEFDNVLVILDNGKWNQYNFENLFTKSGNENVLKRTEKIFYVCCTRAKEKLYVFYCKPSTGVLNRANEWFGKDNVIKI